MADEGDIVFYQKVSGYFCFVYMCVYSNCICMCIQVVYLFVMLGCRSVLSSCCI